jgi:hypothetical protein
MKKLEGLKIKSSPLDRLMWNGDLIYFEGPLLSHYHGSHFDEHWLYLWVDKEKSVDRWLLFQVSSVQLEQYLRQEISLLNLLENPYEEGLYCIDIHRDSSDNVITLITYEIIPEEYLPNANSYYKFEPVPKINSYNATDYAGVIFLDSEWSMVDFGILGKVYDELYSFVYTLKNKLISEIISMYPWRGGYSTIGFFNRLRALTPPASVGSMYYASPGHIILEVDKEAALLLEDSLLGYIKNKSDVDALIRQIEAYLQKTELTSINAIDIRNNSLTLTKEQLNQLQSFLQNLTSYLKLTDNHLNVTDSSSISEIKALLAYVRRLSKLEYFHTENLAQFSTVLQGLNDKEVGTESASSKVGIPLDESDIPF